MREGRGAEAGARFPPAGPGRADPDGLLGGRHGGPGELRQVDQSLDAVGDPDEDAERNQLGDLAAQSSAHRGAVGERLEGVRPHRPKGQPGLQVPCVEPEECAGDALPAMDGLGGRTDAPPGQLGDGDEPGAGEDGMAGAVVQRHEHAEPLDRGDGAGEGLPGVQRFQEGPEFRVLRGGVHAAQPATAGRAPAGVRRARSRGRAADGSGEHETPCLPGRLDGAGAGDRPASRPHARPRCSRG